MGGGEETILTTPEQSRPRKGFLSRIRSRRRNNMDKDDEEEDEVPSPVSTEPPTPPTEEVPTRESRQDATSRKNNNNFLPKRTRVNLQSAPTARDSAFSGPPRYDWIDIETAAAIKVQSAFRRNKAMSQLDAQGVSTAAMRRRRSKSSGSNLFACCGMDLAIFGDDTEEDRMHEKELYLARKKQKEQREEELRKTYRKTHLAQRGRGNSGYEEALEVVEE